jgi:hypothetical protein
MEIPRAMAITQPQQIMSGQLRFLGSLLLKETGKVMGFHAIDRDTDYLLPPSVQEGLPEAHLARYVVEVVEALDLSALERAYAGRGSEAYPPRRCCPC